MIPEVGQRFGPYEILGRLGSGGMGLVFRAWDGRLQRQVAVKLLHNDYKMPAMRERFLQEARAASGLNHPNICTVFDIGEQGGDPYLVMELLEGETLKERIARGALSPEEIVHYAREAADALEVAHVKGIVHRDIKPANIFLVKMPNGRSQAKVLDFGLAKIGLSARGGWGSRTLDLTLAGATVGTLAYMSPEQARGEALDARSDLFSLGVVMYEMATRQVPFKGTTSAMVLVQLMHNEPERVRNWNEAIPSDVERVILKLLSKNRGGRFQTAKELQEALGKIARKMSKARWLQKGATTAVVPLVRAPDPVAREKRPRKRPSGERDDAGADELSAGKAGGTTDSSGDMPVGSVANVPARDIGDRVGGDSPAADSGGGATENEKILARLEGAAAESETSAWQRVAALAKARSGMTQFDYGLDELYGQGSSLAAGAVEDDVGSGSHGAKARWDRGVARVAVAAALIVVAAGGIFLLVRSGRFLPSVLEPGDGLLLTVIQNKTADKTLDGTVMQGLEIALRQSNRLNVMGGEAYRAGLRQVEAEGGDAAKTLSARRVAEKVGAKEYLYGEIKGTEAPYSIDVDVLDTESNDKLVSLEETAESRDQIPAAVGRLAMALRAEVGERGKVGSGMNVPLERDATANIDALHAFSVGEAMRESGRTGDALTAYLQAVTLDPRFVQAQMRLAWLYRLQKAEAASANAAVLARDASAHASDKMKLLAEFCYEINAVGDYVQAVGVIRKLATLYPHDAEGMRELARVLRLQGELQEALRAAQASYGDDPFDAEAYGEAELAMIGMDRYDGALQLEAQAQRIGVTPSGHELTAGYLAGRQDVVAGQVSVLESTTPVETQVTYAQVNDYGLYLDNTGQMKTGDAVWNTAATKADGVLEFTSTRAYLLAQGALDRALVESCNEALAMAAEVKDLERGPVASFNAGMAAALCGDLTYAEKTVAELLESYPQSSAVTEYYVPDLKAAAEIGVNEPAKALEFLAGVGKYDQVSLTPYLRGLAHEAMGQMPLAVEDFQTVLAHRGAAFEMGSNVYPMAEIGVARSLAARGNKTESVGAYKSFLELWSSGDQGHALVTEATIKSR